MPKTKPQTFGAIITALRKDRGLSGNQLARDAGMDPTGLGRIERGVNQPSWESVQRLARALGVSTEELRTLSS